MKNILKKITISLLLLINILLPSDNDSLRLSLKTDYFKNYYYDSKHIITSPSRWNKEDYLIFGSIITTTAGLYFIDEDIRDFFKDNQTETINDIASVAEKFGDKYYISSFLVASYLSGYLLDNKKLIETTLLGIESLIISAVFTHTLKQIFHRHRPFTNDGNNVFDGPFYSTNDDILSFPSGHSTSSFAVATIFANQYANDNLFLSSLIYSMATLTAVSRVYDEEHWASDIFIGAAIGYFTGKTIYNLNQTRKKNQKKNSISIIPITNFKSNSFGLNLIYKF